METGRATAPIYNMSSNSYYHGKVSNNFGTYDYSLEPDKEGIHLLIWRPRCGFSFTAKSPSELLEKLRGHGYRVDYHAWHASIKRYLSDPFNKEWWRQHSDIGNHPLKHMDGFYTSK